VPGDILLVEEGGTVPADARRHGAEYSVALGAADWLFCSAVASSVLWLRERPAGSAAAALAAAHASRSCRIPEFLIWTREDIYVLVALGHRAEISHARAQSLGKRIPNRKGHYCVDRSSRRRID
jgi:hypothetical protein